MHSAYRTAIGYFALFGLLLLGSGAVLFFSKIGFSPEAMTLYYLGNDESAGKSAYGLLETAVPHLGAMGLFIMVLGHFMLFAPNKAKRKAIKLTVTLLIAAAFDIISGPMIAAGYTFWVWIKLGAFATLLLLGVLLALFILYFSFWHSLSPQRHPQ
jgi:hypothetical protein